MIVKILRKSETFKGVRYNTSKIDKNKGELMKVQNFGALQGLDYLRPQDYINYLEVQSSRNARTKYPQFHAVISAKGRSHNKDQLAEIAEQWLNGMGYGAQPYLLIFHKDTGNNHIHMVSTRISKDGRKISDSYEKIKAYKVLNQILGVDNGKAVIADVEKALSYTFSTRAQFMMILEAQGYSITPSLNDYKVSKFGKELTQIPIADVDQLIADYQKKRERIAQLRAIIKKYRLTVDPAIYPMHRELPRGRAKILTEFSSMLADLLKEKFGVQILFHYRDDKPPYGYTILDHAAKAVFKGGEVMSLKEFIAPLKQESLTPGNSVKNAECIADRNIDYSISAQSSYSEHSTEYETGFYFSLQELQIDISEDIDDEAVLGRNRRRKRKARTNTR